MAAWYVEQGFGTLKTKAGADMHEDLEMVRGVRDAVGDKLKLRIDPNRAYSPQQALRTWRGSSSNTTCNISSSRSPPSR